MSPSAIDLDVGIISASAIDLDVGIISGGITKFFSWFNDCLSSSSLNWLLISRLPLPWLVAKKSSSQSIYSYWENAISAFATFLAEVPDWSTALFKISLFILIFIFSITNSDCTLPPKIKQVNRNVVEILKNMPRSNWEIPAPWAYYC